MDIQQLVIDTLNKAGKPMKAGEIADSAGVDKKEIDKAIQKLKKEGKLESPKVCYYSPK
jgi:DNA-binding IscR family transcriptional regulator